MDRFLRKGGKSNTPLHKQHGHSAQKKLSQCAKVVKLKASKHSICPLELSKLKVVLESSQSEPDVIKALRHLDSLSLHSKDLVQSQVGKAVKNLRRHGSKNIKVLAAKMTQKWREIIVRETTSAS
eukprot:jgi/Ulvmu1/7824/UM004_0053.1